MNETPSSEEPGVSAAEWVRSRYGDVDLGSGPVDPEHPTFGSLLGALRAVHEGAAGPDLLVRYHHALRAEVDASRRAVEAEPDVPETADRRRVTLTALTVVRVALDSLERYLAEPSAEGMARTVEQYLHSQRIVRDARAWLEERGGA